MASFISVHILKLCVLRTPFSLLLFLLLLPFKTQFKGHLLQEAFLTPSLVFPWSFMHIFLPPVLHCKELFTYLSISLSDCEPLKGRAFYTALEIPCGEDKTELFSRHVHPGGEDKQFNNHECTQCLAEHRMRPSV